MSNPLAPLAGARRLRMGRLFQKLLSWPELRKKTGNLGKTSASTAVIGLPLSSRILDNCGRTSIAGVYGVRPAASVPD